MAEEKETSKTSELQTWITKYKLTKLSQQIEEEEITLEFLLSQSEDSIQEIAKFLSPSNPIQQKKLIFAVTEYKKLKATNNSPSSQEMKEPSISSDKVIDNTSLQSLISMGFDRDKAIITLLSVNNDILRAIEILTSNKANDSTATATNAIWDGNKGIGKYIQINDKLLSLDSIIKVRWNEFSRAYLRQVISSDNKTHRFKFKLEYVDKPQSFDASPYSIYCGIAQDDVESFDIDMKCRTPDKKGVYVFDGWGGKIGIFGQKSKAYGKDCVCGDILEMVIDTYKYTLSYSINDKDYGVATKISGSKWRAFLAFHNPRHKIKFVSYSSN